VFRDDRMVEAVVHAGRKVLPRKLDVAVAVPIPLITGIATVVTAMFAI
jgi:hypothetical protein